MRRLPVALVCALCLARAALAAEPTAADPPRILVRQGEHPGFSRLVVDWTEPVGRQLSRDGNRATLSFDRPAALDLARVLADLPSQVAAVETRLREDAVDLLVTVPEGAKLRVGRDGTKIYLDVLKPDAEPTARADNPAAEHPEETASSQSETPASFGREPTPSPATTSQPLAKPIALAARPSSEPQATPAPEPELESARRPVPEPPEAEALATAAVAAEKVAADEAAEGEPAAPALSTGEQRPQPQPAETEVVAVEPAASPEVDVPEPAATVTLPATAAATDIEPVPVVPSAAEPQASAEVAPPAASEPEGPRTGIFRLAAVAPQPPQPPLDGLTVTVEPLKATEDKAALPGRHATPPTAQRLRFDWPVPVAAAVFRHQGSLWLVFDRAVKANLVKSLARDAPDLAPIRQLPLEDATVLRLSPPAALTPRLTRENNSWLVELRTQVPLPEVELLAEVEERGGAPLVAVALSQPGRLIRLPAPGGGQELIVVPLGAAGAAMASAQDFPQLRLLETYQGAVVQPLADGVLARVVADVLLLGTTEGLYATAPGPSAVMAQAPVEAAQVIGPRLLDLAAWRQGGQEAFRSNKQRLHRQVAAAASEDRPFARLALARFFFAHGLAAEALGAVRLLFSDVPRMAEDPELQLIAGASLVMLEDYAAAREALAFPALAADPDAALWQAALAAAGQSWSAAAAGFAGQDTLIADYPPSVRNELRLLAAEARLAVADSGTASLLLDAVRADRPNPAAQARIAFLEGKRLQLEGDIAAASAIWRDLAYSRPGPASARAWLALVEQGLADATMAPEQAIDELEHLRFAWRGDAFEFALLQRLGELYLQIGEPRSGLRRLREAASNFPELAGAESVAARMSDVFRDLFLGEAGEGVPALRALAIYEEFKELTPVGTEGDKVIAKLADRLVAVDLLNRAGKLLEGQIRHRLTGVDKARIGARLAVIRLLDRDPTAALEALAISDAAGLEPSLLRERRHLEAQALSSLGRDSAALALVADETDEQGLRLKAEILREAGKWSDAAKALMAVAPSSPPVGRGLTLVESRTLMDLAVALTLGGERAALKKLDERFGAAMAETPQAAAFKLLAGDLGGNGGLSIAEELVKVDQAEAFLTSYRQRLQQAGLSDLN